MTRRPGERQRHRPLRAGERVRFEAARASVQLETNESIFDCRVTVGDRLVCTAEFTLEAP